MTSNDIHNLLVDTDAGVDDLLALFVLTRLRCSPAFHLAVTFGNVPVDRALENVSILASLAGTAPARLFRGHARPLRGEAHFAYDVHGEDGIGGASRKANPPLPT